MKKQWHGLIIGVLVLLFLVLLYLCMEQLTEESKQEETTTETVVVEVIAIPEEEMQTITIENEAEKLLFVKEEEEESHWFYAEDREFPLNETNFEGIAAALEEINAVRVLEDPEELSEYGLEEPSYQVSVTTEEESWTLLFGSQNTSTGDYYAKLEGYAEVYTIDSTTARYFQCSLYDLAVQDTFPTIDGGTVTAMEIEIPEEAPILFTKEEESWSVEQGDYQAGADSEKSSELTDELGNFVYASFVDYHATEPELYGLDEPSARITIEYTTTETIQAETEETPETLEGETEYVTEAETEMIETEHQVILEVGSQDGAGNYYVRMEGSDEVYTMQADVLVSWVTLRYVDCVESTVYSVPITGMEQMNLSYQGETYELTWSEEAEETGETTFVYYVNDREVESTVFTQFCNKASNMQAQSRLEEVPENLGEAELTFKYTCTDGTVQEVSYYAYENGFYLVVSETGLPGLVSKLDFESLVGELEVLLEE